MKFKIMAAAFIAAAAVATPASAYTTFLLPQDFWPAQGTVMVQGASTQTILSPGAAIPGDLQVLNPDGTPGVLNGTEVGTDSTTVHVDLAGQGTYRISTGEQTGDPTPILRLADGTCAHSPCLARFTPGQAIPDGATQTTLQSVKVANTYVTYGSPSRTAVDQNTGHLVIHPITDPNQITVASGLQIEVLLDGAPLSEAIVVYAAGDAETKLDRFVSSDATGHAAITFDAPGHYVIAVRHIADAPAGGAGGLNSYATTLTFDVMAAEHPNVQVQTPEPQQQAPRPRPRPPAHRAGRPDR